jgi:predicted DNA-binding protein (MmcQ/YjbR family)
MKKTAKPPPITQSRIDAARKRIERIIARLPEACAVAQGVHLSLEVRKKRFGWYLVDHHGDGRIAINCKGSADLHEVLAQTVPLQFHVPKFLGQKGWIGLWLDVASADWSQVEFAVRGAYLLVAPKLLVRQLTEAPKMRTREDS